MPGESFKSFHEITAPDPRNVHWVLVDRITGARRQITLTDVHADLEALELSESVPIHIREHFLTARHLALYSWFVYSFHMPAQTQALASLEYALRERFAELGFVVPTSLRNQLEYAIKHRLLRNERFRDWPGHGVDQENADWEWLNSWAQRLPESISYMRNEFAHGTFAVLPYGTLLRLIADAINQLYDQEMLRNSVVSVP